MVSLDYAAVDNAAALYLARGSDLSLKDASGKSARDHAVDGGHAHAIGMIDALVERSSLAAAVLPKPSMAVEGGRPPRSL